MILMSPTKGALTLEEVAHEISEYIYTMQPHEYQIVVGSDSQSSTFTCFVTAVVIYTVGKGARYFYCKRDNRLITSLRQKIIYETSLSLELAYNLKQLLRDQGLQQVQLEIHLDIGTRGKTQDLIKEATGMVAGNGFQAKIKPEAFGAYTVANRYTKY